MPAQNMAPHDVNVAVQELWRKSLNHEKVLGGHSVLLDCQRTTQQILDSISGEARAAFSFVSPIRYDGSSHQVSFDSKRFKASLIHADLRGLDSDDHLQYTLRDDWAQNGFENTTDSDFTFTDGTRLFSIQPTATSFNYFIAGFKYTSTGDTLTIEDTEGIHYIYYDGATISESVNPSNTDVSTLWQNKATISIIYWDATNKQAIYIGEERHGKRMSSTTHVYLHFNEGLRYRFGLGLNTISADQTGADDAHAQFGVDAGAASDEDLYKAVSAVASTTGLDVYYLDGANGNLRLATNSGFSILTTGTGRMAWNEWTGAVWQISEVSNTKFAFCHVFVTTDKNSPLKAIMGQSEYATKVEAQSGALTEIGSLLISGLPLPEMKPIATIIFQTSDVYGNAVKSRIRLTEDGDDYIDWRDEAISRTALSTNNHNALTNLAVGDFHTQYLPIDGSRAMTGNLRTGGYWISNDGDDEGIFILANGNVGVGMSVGITEKLHVTGNILATGTIIGSNLNISNWDTAYSWGDHAGLYDPIDTASSTISTHESTYNHVNYNTAYSHSQVITGNPHGVTKTEVGLGNVPNTDCTNASNISSGTLNNDRLPSTISVTSLETNGGQLTIANTSPDLIFKDTDCTDSDVNASITADATDTGSGTEDVDVLLRQQIAGALTTFLSSIADSPTPLITLGDGSRNIKLDGNVGVNTATPSERLELLGTSETSLLLQDNNGSTYNPTGLYLHHKKSGSQYEWFVGNPSDGGGNQLVVGANATTSHDNSAALLTNSKVTILASNGNVGIGVSPTYNLHVYESSNSIKYLAEFLNNNAGVSAAASLRVTSDDAVAIIRTYSAANTGVDSGGNPRAGGVDFGTISGSKSVNMLAGGERRVTVLSTGEVGIGTVTPLAKLDVNGSRVLRYGFYDYALKNGATALAEDGNWRTYVENTTNDLVTETRVSGTWTEVQRLSAP